MKNSDSKELDKLKKILISVYLLGIIGWCLTWFFVDGFQYSSKIYLLWFPFIACIVILVVNLLLWKDIDKVDDPDNYDKELQKIQYVERNAAHMVTSITGVLLIATAISAIKSNSPIPSEAILFESLAFICAVVGVLPKYWIPSRKPYWLVILRHLKTVPFTYAISLFLGGLIILLNWL